MKNLKNTWLVLVLITLLFTAINVSAAETDADVNIERQAKIEERKVMKEEKKAMLNERKANREGLKNDIKLNKEEAKLNRSEFKKSKDEMKEIFSDVSQNAKDELKILRAEHKENTALLSKEVKNTDLTLEERNTIKSQLKELNDMYNQKVSDLVSSSDTATAFLAEREELKAKNDILRKESKETRELYREGRGEKIELYKELLWNKLIPKLPKVSNTKLELISVTIEAMVERLEANTTMSESKKDSLIAQIISFKEIMDDELEARILAEEEIDLDDIFED